MSKLDFIKKLYNARNCYSDHMTKEELQLIHISSKVEDILLELLKAKKIVFLTGNPGDGKTFMIKMHMEDIESWGTYIETDMNKVSDFSKIASSISDCVKNNKPAVIAVNEYQFFQLTKEMKAISPELYNEILKLNKNGIIYDLPKGNIQHIAIIDLNERSMLDKDRNLGEQLLLKMSKMLLSEELHNKQLGENIVAVSNEDTRKQILDLVDMAAMIGSHFAVRDILGAFSFMLTACDMDEYYGIPYYDALFKSKNSLLMVVQQFDPIYLTVPELDEKLWNGEITEGWVNSIPKEFPSDDKYAEDIEGAIECFKSVKRRFYFENSLGYQLAAMQPREIIKCSDMFVNFETQNRKIKEKIIRSLNKLFLPAPEEKRQLRIWTTHHFDLSRDAGTAISSRYIDSSDLELLMPRPAEWLKGMEYRPNHILLKPKGVESPVLVLDIDFLRTLDAIDEGYPVALLAPQYEQTTARFLQKLCDDELTCENDGGEIIVASRKKSYQNSVFIQDNKYSFEED